MDLLHQRSWTRLLGNDDERVQATDYAVYDGVAHSLRARIHRSHQPGLHITRLESRIRRGDRHGLYHNGVLI